MVDALVLPLLTTCSTLFFVWLHSFSFWFFFSLSSTINKPKSFGKIKLFSHKQLDPITTRCNKSSKVDGFSVTVLLNNINCLHEEIFFPIAGINMKNRRFVSRIECTASQLQTVDRNAMQSILCIFAFPLNMGEKQPPSTIQYTHQARLNAIELCRVCLSDCECLLSGGKWVNETPRAPQIDKKYYFFIQRHAIHYVVLMYDHFVRYDALASLGSMSWNHRSHGTRQLLGAHNKETNRAHIHSYIAVQMSRACTFFNTTEPPESNWWASIEAISISSGWESKR